MARRELSDGEKLDALVSALTERIVEMPGDEFMEELREDGDDPDEMARRGRAVRLRAMKDFRLREVRVARAERDRLAAEYEQQRDVIYAPPPHVCRELLGSIDIGQLMSGGRATAQFHNLREMTDEDVIGCYRQLVLLGVIDANGTEPEEAAGDRS